MLITVNNQKVNITGKAAGIIKNQPGYQPKAHEYYLCRTTKGGIRLYANISGKLMDASLEDITDKSIAGLVEE